MDNKDIAEKIEDALNILWDIHGNGFNTEHEKPIAILQELLEEIAGNE